MFKIAFSDISYESHDMYTFMCCLLVGVTGLEPARLAAQFPKLVGNQLPVTPRDEPFCYLYSS